MRASLPPAKIAQGLRGLGVLLGACVSFGRAFVCPPVSRVGLTTIPLWQLVLRRLGPGHDAHPAA